MPFILPQLRLINSSRNRSKQLYSITDFKKTTRMPAEVVYVGPASCHQARFRAGFLRAIQIDVPVSSEETQHSSNSVTHPAPCATPWSNSTAPASYRPFKIRNPNPLYT